MVHVSCSEICSSVCVESIYEISGRWTRTLLLMVLCISFLFLYSVINFILTIKNSFPVDARIGRMAYVRMMLMDPSCMRTGTKTYGSSVMAKMVGDSYSR